MAHFHLLFHMYGISRTHIARLFPSNYGLLML